MRSHWREMGAFAKLVTVVVILSVLWWVLFGVSALLGSSGTAHGIG